jgi:hypothetical protein
MREDSGAPGRTGSQQVEETLNALLDAEDDCLCRGRKASSVDRGSYPQFSQLSCLLDAEPIAKREADLDVPPSALGVANVGSIAFVNYVSLLAR